jgi:hypothetical protein
MEPLEGQAAAIAQESSHSSEALTEAWNALTLKASQQFKIHELVSLHYDSYWLKKISLNYNSLELSQRAGFLIGLLARKKITNENIPQALEV